MKVSGYRSKISIFAFVILASTFTTVFQYDTAHAAQITGRKITLQKNSGVSTGGSAPNALANHKFDFTLPSNTAVGSVKFQYCTTASGTCTMPTGLVTNTGVTLTGASGNLSGFTLNTTTNGAPYLTNAGTPNVTGATAATLVGVTNPTAANTTFFVRISTHASTNGTGGTIDSGVVAASTAQTITVTGIMPEYLSFCTGGTITVNSGIPDCSSATSGAINFNQEFSPSQTATATSMMAASTNAGSGYSIVVTGTTLTSGANTIPAIGTTPLASNTSRGTSKFGINLILNTTTTSSPVVGANIDPTSNASNLRALATSAYDTADEFALDLTGATAIANSDNTTPGSSVATDSQAYTISYIANVAGSQPAGTYVATINYVCTPTF